MCGILAGAVTLYAWDLDQQGWANAYYTAAAQAGSQSWRSFFYGSLETGNAVATDKPPASLWLMALSFRVFGRSSWSLILPQVLQSAASVLVLHRTVRRCSGTAAALIAAIVLATTPAFFVLARFNHPDTLLTLLVLSAAYCTVRASASDRPGWLISAGGLLGLAFLTKWMVAFLPAPAIVLTLVRSRRRGRSLQIRRISLVLVSVVVAGSWWVIAVLFTPAAGRPYADASGGNIVNLIVGQNGFSRLGSGGLSGPNPIAGHAGPLRLLEQPFSAQIGWLLPLALCAMICPLLLGEPAALNPGYVLFGGWFAATAAVFSMMQGSMHPYYTCLLAPALAALIGIGAADLWRAGLWPFMLAALTTDAAYAIHVVAGYSGAPRWATLLICGTALAAVGLLTGDRHRHRHSGSARSSTVLRTAAIVAAALSVLTGPALFDLATLQRPVTGSNPLAGPERELRVEPYPAALLRFLNGHHHGQTWLAAVPIATAASRLQLQSGISVLPLGGFTGHTPAPSIEALQRWVDQDRLRYLVFNRSSATDSASSANPHPTAAADLISWARRHSCPTPFPHSSFVVLDLERRACPTPAARERTGSEQRRVPPLRHLARWAYDRTGTSRATRVGALIWVSPDGGWERELSAPGAG